MIVHIHLNDGKPTGHLTWGDGEQPLEEHLATLARHDYTGDLSLELGADRYYADPSRIWNGAFGCWKRPLAKR